MTTVIIWIAKLGEFLGLQKDGEPGIKCLWKGVKRLFDIALSWKEREIIFRHRLIYSSEIILN
ncbi:MAG: hypothetical protein MGG11_00545 [Trichodesmium sp. MAG_R03]|jgi:hypothetical protein|nr:hypothetical protein [Trichodesmium sp. MAG_R03]